METRRLRCMVATLALVATGCHGPLLMGVEVSSSIRVPGLKTLQATRDLALGAGGELDLGDLAAKAARHSGCSTEGVEIETGEPLARRSYAEYAEVGGWPATNALTEREQVEARLQVQVGLFASGDREGVQEEQPGYLIAAVRVHSLYRDESYAALVRALASTVLSELESRLRRQGELQGLKLDLLTPSRR